MTTLRMIQMYHLKCLQNVNKHYVHQIIRAKAIWYKSKSKSDPTDIALKHFDNFYSKVYKNNWQSIRLGLMSPNKYVSIVNNFCDYESIEVDLRLNGAKNLRHVYERNLKRILKNIELKKFIQSRQKLPTDVIGDIPIPTLTSDSETDDILNFLSESEGESDTQFINEAGFDLDLNDYIPVTDLSFKEEIVDDSAYFSFCNMEQSVPVEFTEQSRLEISPMLNLYTFSRNDFSSFPPPSISKANLFNYYLVDGSSVLPALALGIEDGDYVADWCAAPGGKALVLFFTLKNCRFFFNELSQSRFLRLKNVFNSFVPKSSQTNIEFSNRDALGLQKYDTFDKILVDVPCSNDRHSLYLSDNNIFSSKRHNERVNLPYKQMDLLFEALHSVKVGGSIVYSTCSLSPIQNDGVVHMALKKVWQETNMQFSVVDMRQVFKPFKSIFKLKSNFKYGIQVVPFLPSNFSPMYFAKLTRTN